MAINVIFLSILLHGLSYLIISSFFNLCIWFFNVIPKISENILSRCVPYTISHYLTFSLTAQWSRIVASLLLSLNAQQPSPRRLSLCHTGIFDLFYFNFLKTKFIGQKSLQKFSWFFGKLEDTNNWPFYAHIYFHYLQLCAK